MYIYAAINVREVKWLVVTIFALKKYELLNLDYVLSFCFYKAMFLKGLSIFSNVYRVTEIKTFKSLKKKLEPSWV